MNFALLEAYDLVVAQFAQDGVGALNKFGWRKNEEHIKQAQVVWEPGDAGGDVGETELPESTQTYPPVLGTLWHQCSLYITAPADPTDPNNERKQWANTMTLRNILYRALIKSVGQGIFRVMSERYVVDVARRAAVTVCMVVAVRDLVLDEAPGYQALHPWTAEVDLHEYEADQVFPVPA